MEYLQRFIDQIKSFLTWWIIISPWERGIRVRFGKKIKMLDPGIHFRVPIFDHIYSQTIRSRNISSSIQTISTIDGITISLGIIIQYSITDIFKLYNTLYHPELTIQNMIWGKISKHISESTMKDCTGTRISECLNSINMDEYGIKLEELGISTYAIVKTFRLIQDSSWVSDNGFIMTNKQ